MKAVRFHGTRDLRVEDVAPPSAPAEHEVLVRPIWCGICGTDLHEYVAGPIVTPREPHALTGATLPQIMGHEFSAVVEATGRGVATVRPGDRVAIMPLLFCGRCYYCRRGLNHLCDTMAATGLSWAWGGLGERAIVPDYQVARLPDTVSDLQGALVEPGAVALYGAERGGVSAGDAVLVTGAGPIGCLSILAARALGATEIYVSEPNSSRRALAERLGVTAVLDPTGDDVARLMREATDGRGVDVAIEASGVAPALRTCLASVRRRGTVSQVALHGGPVEIDAWRLSRDDVTLVGTWCFNVFDWPRVISLIGSGQYPVERVVTNRISIDRIVQDGYEELIDPAGQAVKVLVSTTPGETFQLAAATTTAN